MYDTTPDRAAELAAAQETGRLADTWTPAAQDRYKHLTSLPEASQAFARMEIGYLEEAKNAAERKGL